MLKWANKTAQPIADEVETLDYEVTVADGTAILARWSRDASTPVVARGRPQRHHVGSAAAKWASRSTVVSAGRMTSATVPDLGGEDCSCVEGSIMIHSCSEDRQDRLEIRPSSRQWLGKLSGG
jgi:hypothetical protein